MVVKQRHGTLLVSTLVGGVFLRLGDTALGWRFPVLGSFFEASAGYAFNLQGTVLQDTTQSMIAINPKWITFAQAGGPAAAVAYGWLF